MNASETAVAVRSGAGLFELRDRALLELRGADRVRWLNGQVTADVSGLDPSGPRSGSYALLLTPQGRIVADLHVVARPDAFWIELARAALDATRARFEKYVIADDVKFEDDSAAFARLALEGPRAREILSGALGRAITLMPDAAAEVPIADADVVVAAYGWSGEAAFQLLVPTAAADRVIRALRAAGRGRGLVDASPEALETLRVEAGVPRFGCELGEDALPAELGGAGGMERAVSFTKGCYTGQEVVARMASRGRVSHRLVGIALESDEPPVAGAPVQAEKKRVGEVTSATRSPRAGTIVLAYVRLPHDAPGSALEVGGIRGRVVALPFVTPTASTPRDVSRA